MTYTMVVIVAALLASLLDMFMLRTRLLLTKRFWIFMTAMLPLFLIVNGVLTAIPIVRYAPEAIIGFRVLTIPVEDFAYMFALLTPVVSLYEWMKRRRAMVAED